jgi:hypothetical protein
MGQEERARVGEDKRRGGRERIGRNETNDWTSLRERQE